MVSHMDLSEVYAASHTVMELVSPGKDSLFLIEENAVLEENSLEVDHMPVTMTMNVLADASGNIALASCTKNTGHAKLHMTCSGSVCCHCGAFTAAQRHQTGVAKVYRQSRGPGCTSFHTRHSSESTENSRQWRFGDKYQFSHHFSCS